MNQTLKPNQHLIVLSGNIGSGKTSLTQLLSERFGWQASYESVENNPYLADFYADLRSWAFHLQMYFLGNRAQEVETLLDSDRSAIMDRSIYEDAHIFGVWIRSSNLTMLAPFQEVYG